MGLPSIYGAAINDVGQGPMGLPSMGGVAINLWGGCQCVDQLSIYGASMNV